MAAWVPQGSLIAPYSKIHIWGEGYHYEGKWVHKIFSNLLQQSHLNIFIMRYRILLDVFRIRLFVNTKSFDMRQLFKRRSTITMSKQRKKMR